MGSIENPLKPLGLQDGDESDGDVEISAAFCTGDVGDENPGVLALSFGVEWFGKPFCTCADFFGVGSSSCVLFSSFTGDAKLLFSEDLLLIEPLCSFCDVVKFGIVAKML